MTDYRAIYSDFSRKDLIEQINKLRNQIDELKSMSLDDHLIKIIQQQLEWHECNK